MNLGPIHNHMREILAHERSEDLILIGGAAILLKNDWLARVNARTLLAEIPPARATEDLDFALALDLFADAEKGLAVRKMIDELGYQSKTDFMQFTKDGVQMDLMSREPEGAETKSVKCNKRDRRVGSKVKINLHGIHTPEAFGVEESPLTISALLDTADGEQQEFLVRVAHPFGLLNMKVRAAHDRHVAILSNELPKNFSEKHALDVVILISAMTEAELQHCESLATKFANHALAKAIRTEAHALFATRESEGFRLAARQASVPLDHELFWEVLHRALGVANAV